MFGKLFGRKGSTGRGSGEGPPSDPQAIGENDPRIAAGQARLQAYWDAIGPTDPDLISYLVNPQFQGSPAWPNMRQAFRVVRPAGSLILASDGLSDPFVGTNMTDAQGFGCEVYIEAPELAGADFADVSRSWAFAAIECFARNVANIGGLSQPLASHGVLSMELPCGESLPPGWATETGMVGALIGVAAPGRPSRIGDMPFGPVDIVPLTLITPEQLGRIVSGGAEARRALATELGHATRIKSDRIA